LSLWQSCCFSGPIALAGQETLWTGTRPNDYFDLLLLKESTERWVAIVGLVVIGVLAVVVYARTSHVRDQEIEKKVEDEFNEIKQRYDMDLDPKSSSADREPAIAESQGRLPDN
jgi:hypothetical protein